MKKRIVAALIVLWCAVEFTIHGTIQKFNASSTELIVADYARDELVGPWSAAQLFNKNLVPLRVAVKNIGTTNLMISRNSITQARKPLVCELLKRSLPFELGVTLGVSSWMVACLCMCEESFYGFNFYPFSIAASGGLLAYMYCLYSEIKKYNNDCESLIGHTFLYREKVIEPGESYTTIVLLDTYDFWKPITFVIYDTTGQIVDSYVLKVVFDLNNYYKPSWGLKV